VHIELAPPKGVPAAGKLKDGSLIPLSSAGAYPSTEHTLAAASLLLNGGGLGSVQDITKALGTAFTGREQDLRSLIGQLDKFVAYLNDQKGDIIAATDSLNNLAGRLADQKPVVDKALKTLPQALTVLKDERENLADALDQLGKFGALAADSVNKTKQNLVKELKDLGPVLQSLADAGPALTRSLDFFLTFPFPRPTLSKWLRGDYANLTAVVDLTLSRLDSGLLTGTFLEGLLTQLELQQGRTIGQMPSPYTARNPLTVPYHFDQGP
jgi:phospholipid/cholesterol/gamma-HCH transport system substrate-binding protein